MNYPILSDPSRKVARAYGVLKGLPLPLRVCICIGRDGRIREVVQGDGLDLLERLRGEFLRENP